MWLIVYEVIGVLCACACAWSHLRLGKDHQEFGSVILLVVCITTAIIWPVFVAWLIKQVIEDQSWKT